MREVEATFFIQQHSSRRTLLLTRFFFTPSFLQWDPKSSPVPRMRAVAVSTGLSSDQKSGVFRALRATSRSVSPAGAPLTPPLSPSLVGALPSASTALLGWLCWRSLGLFGAARAVWSCPGLLGVLGAV